jgi:hypothetical protein
LDCGLPARAIFFGLASAEEVFSRRAWLGFPQCELDVVGWLAHTGVSPLEWYRPNHSLGRSANGQGDGCPDTGPEGAPHFLALTRNLAKLG